VSHGIIVGYDGSDCAKAALRAGLEVGRAYDETVTIAFGYELSPVGGEIHDYHLALQELAEGRLAEARQLADVDSGDARANPPIETIVVEQSPAEALVALAEARDARVIVVGTRGERPLHGALIGSTPHKLLHLSRRPVLVVPTGYAGGAPTA
jgi:nucleotide-binding universal stress UspA family protein